MVPTGLPLAPDEDPACVDAPFPPFPLVAPLAPEADETPFPITWGLPVVAGPFDAAAEEPDAGGGFAVVAGDCVLGADPDPDVADAALVVATTGRAVHPVPLVFPSPMGKLAGHVQVKFPGVFVQVVAAATQAPGIRHSLISTQLEGSPVYPALQTHTAERSVFWQ